MSHWSPSEVEQQHSEAHAILLDQAKALAQDVSFLGDGGDTARIGSLIQDAADLLVGPNQLEENDDLNESIVRGWEALSLCLPGHPDRSASLNSLAVDLSSRYEQLGVVDDLNEAIVLDREALSLRPPGHPDRSLSLNNLAVDLFSRFNRLGEIDDLNEAVGLDREALTLRPPGHPDRPTSLNNLTADLSSRFERLGAVDDLNEGIVFTREALSLRPAEHPDRSVSLNNLAVNLFSRYELLGEIDDLKEAIILDREALSLCPPGNPNRSGSLNNLAIHLSFWYTEFGGIKDLNEAIILSQEALSLCPLGHPHHPMSLSNLASRLSSRYSRLGDIDDLNTAIVLGREALSLRPPGDPDRSASLTNLAIHIFFRYKQIGGIDDLDEAIVLAREALSLHPPGYPGRSASLSNLAVNLSSRYELLKTIDDLNEAIVFDREALSLRPLGHPDHSMSLNNLAVDLSFRYNQLGTVDDLNEAIILDRETLSLRPPGHLERSMSLSNLAVDLFSRHELLKGIDDLNEAIVCGREALSLRPRGHPDRSMSLKNLAKCLFFRYGRSREAGYPDTSFEDKQELFGLYAELQHVSQTVTSVDLFAANAWIDTAEKFHHSSILPAYETALRLLVQYLAALPSLPHHLGLHKSFSSSLAVDAFSACLRSNSPTKAVELLEQGRAVFWSQLARLRSPLGNVIESGPQGMVLADEFRLLTSLVRNALNSPSADQHDRVCRLNLELQNVVSKIRELPGLSRFLLPSLFSDLQRAARDGPVIIVNASKYSCDALIVFSEKDPIRILLPITKTEAQELLSQLRTLTRNAKIMDMNEVEREFKIFLRELWDRLVSHIVNALKGTCPHNSRIWWCPTAEFSLLPLHAANPYRDGQKGLSSLYVSSYTTTLTALIHARRPSISHRVVGKKPFIAIGQAAAKDTNKLFHVGPELNNVGQLVDGIATFTRIEGEDACVSNVADELGKNEWVHLACHGIPDQEQPFESAFALHDGRFTIQRLIQCNLQNPEFTYLSACHTTVGDKESPDEVIHLAAAMQFVGFRSVIGTMWAVDDTQTNKVIPLFYKLMIDDAGRLDYTRAARALRIALHKAVVSMDQRILYIHFGA